MLPCRVTEETYSLVGCCHVELLKLITPNFMASVVLYNINDDDGDDIERQ